MCLLYGYRANKKVWKRAFKISLMKKISVAVTFYKAAVRCNQGLWKGKCKGMEIAISTTHISWDFVLEKNWDTWACNFPSLDIYWPHWFFGKLICQTGIVSAGRSLIAMLFQSVKALNATLPNLLRWACHNMLAHHQSLFKKHLQFCRLSQKFE